MKTIAAKLFASVLFGFLVSSALFAADYRYARIEVPNGSQTYVRGINARGDILGSYTDADGVGHDFLLHNGVYTNIDYPGHGVARARAINARGDIAGRFTDANGTDHGFLLRDGKFTQIDYPGASGTWARGIDNAGDIVGSHFNGVGIEHGFILKDGIFHNIHVPSSSCEHVGMAQDNGRAVAGSFCNASDGMLYGFVRTRQGEFQTINFPGQGLICTGARWINERGDVVGPYSKVKNPDECGSANTHGYLMRDGKFVTIDPPGAVSTQPDAINDDGQIVGLYSDKAGAMHGYRAIPKDER